HCHAKLLPLTALVVRTDRFEDWLREKERFAINVRLLAPLLYDAGRVVLPVPNGEPPAFANKATQKARAAGLLKAGEFLAGAELFRLRKQWGMAAFLLHQSAEQSLLALVKTGTGFVPHTHSLERLVRYAALVSYRVAALFPQRTERDKRLFRLLQKAYIDSRYEDYTITEPELACLLERVKALHQLSAGFGKEAAAPVLRSADV
ncbi:MAG: HEPN domain-containing protein, partial [Chitinophagaceae bacterium]